MLRACLIVALLANIGALVVAFLVVGSGFKEKTVALEEATQAKATAETAERTAKSNEKKAVDEQKRLVAELESTTGELTKINTDLQASRRRVKELNDNLTATTEERESARAVLARWNATGVTIEQINQLKIDLQKVREEKEAVVGENTILERSTRILQKKLAVYEGDKEPKVTLPAGLKGKVVAIDPKHDFVILNVGSDQGAEERGEMLVNRAGKLVAKIRLTKVHADRSIANVLPEWKQSDVVEGDAVISGL